MTASPDPRPDTGHDIMKLRLGFPLRKPAAATQGQAGFSGTRELSSSSERNCSCATTVRFRPSITRSGG